MSSSTAKVAIACDTYRLVESSLRKFFDGVLTRAGTQLDDEIIPEDVDVFVKLRELSVEYLPGRVKDAESARKLNLRSATLKQVFNQAVISDSVQTFKDITDWDNFDIFKYACSACNLFPELFFTLLGKSGMDILWRDVEVCFFFIIKVRRR